MILSMKLIYMLIIICSVLLIASCSETGPGEAFAKCVTDSGVKMYGAYWCPHCLSQKKDFGDSWMYINYVECSLPNMAGQTEECNEAGIESYPTWFFADGSRISSEMSMEALADKAGCELNTVV